MTYWIVFAVFTLSEEIVDILCSFWLPLYYECKILLIVWLLSPATWGSTLIYRQVIHPALVNREEEIDQLVKRWKEQGYHLGVK
jgi:receptor expression-enhancing protein 1/2/3/4